MSKSSDISRFKINAKYSAIFLFNGNEGFKNEMKGIIEDLEV